MCQISREKVFKIKLAALVIVLTDIFLQTFLRSRYIGFENTGVSFGMGTEWGSILSILAYTALICWYLYERWGLRNDQLYLYLLALGGAGNLVCRLVWGSVWDYISLSIFPFSFNLSDVLVCLGAVSYILGVNGDSSFIRRQRDTGHK